MRDPAVSLFQVLAKSVSDPSNSDEATGVRTQNEQTDPDVSLLQVLGAGTDVGFDGATFTKEAREDTDASLSWQLTFVD